MSVIPRYQINQCVRRGKSPVSPEFKYRLQIPHSEGGGAELLAPEVRAVRGDSFQAGQSEKGERRNFAVEKLTKGYWQVSRVAVTGQESCW